jgi:hypothetical protein
MLDKRTVATNLHSLIHTRLFRDRPWYAGRETYNAVNRALFDWGLQEHVLGALPKTTRPTLAGVELEIDLVMVFLGIRDDWDTPHILEQHGLIDETEENRIYDLLDGGDEPECVLRPVVLKAFGDHYNPSGLLA